MAKKKQWQLDDQLRRAVERDDMESVRDLLARGASVLAVGAGDTQLLALARDEPIARLLVEAGADPCAVDGNGITPGGLIRLTYLAVEGVGFAAAFPGLGAAADYLEDQERLRNNAQELEACTPQAQMTDEEERAKAMARRR